MEWLRSTLVKKDGIWVMMEYCERVSEMVEPNRFIEETPGRQQWSHSRPMALKMSKLWVLVSKEVKNELCWSCECFG